MRKNQNQKRPALFVFAFCPSRAAPHRTARHVVVFVFVVVIVVVRGCFASRAHPNDDMAPPRRGRSARDGATAGGDAVRSLDDAVNARIDALAAKCDALEAKCDALAAEGFRV